MTYKPVSIPALPAGVDPQMRQFLTSIKESLEVRLRQRGSALDSSPTFKDLLDTGLLKIKDSVTTIGGKQYTAEQLLGIVEFTLPSWVTSDTAPPAPTGLAVTSDKTSTVLSWDLSGFDSYAETEVWRATENNLSLAQQIGSTSGNTYVDSLPDPGVVYYYWIRDVSYNFLIGPFNDVNGASTALGPSTMTVTSGFIDSDATLTWTTPVSNLAVSLYRIEYLDGSWQPLSTVSGNAHRFRVTWGGARQFRIAGVDINGNQGPYTTFTITITSPPAPEASVTFNGEQAVVSWIPPLSMLPVDRYEIYDTSISSANLLGTQYSTVFRTKVIWQNKTLIIRAIDSAGNVGTSRSVSITVSTGVVNTLTTEVIDNNVLFRWTSTAGSLPILTFDLRRGPTWASATSIGTKSGGFTTVFEAPQFQTTYTYWLAAVDTAGNYGTPVSVTATVNQPPDYVLAANYTSAYTGTFSNAVLTGNAVVLPVNTTETWDAHFSSRGWGTPQAQVDAGYPIFAQPGSTTGYYEEVFDYGATLAAMKITAAYLLTTVAGSLSTTVTLTAALDSGFTTNVQTFTGAQAYAVNFRYVKVRIAVTATDDKGIAELSNFTVKLDTKLKSQTGNINAISQRQSGTYSQTGTTITVSATAHGWVTGNQVRLDFLSGTATDDVYTLVSHTTDTFTVTSATSTSTSGNVDIDNTGTIVYLTEDRLSTGPKTFIDVESITLAANSTTPLYAVYDFTDTPNPLSFKVLLFNSSGTRVSGTVSYAVRGY